MLSTDEKEASVYDEIAAPMDTPGAAISGFITPSYLGPRLENDAIAPPVVTPVGVTHSDA